MRHSIHFGRRLLKLTEQNQTAERLLEQERVQHSASSFLGSLQLLHPLRFPVSERKETRQESRQSSFYDQEV